MKARLSMFLFLLLLTGIWSEYVTISVSTSEDSTNSNSTSDQLEDNTTISSEPEHTASTPGKLKDSTSISGKVKDSSSIYGEMKDVFGFDKTLLDWPEDQVLGTDFDEFTDDMENDTEIGRVVREQPSSRQEYVQQEQREQWNVDIAVVIEMRDGFNETSLTTMAEQYVKSMGVAFSQVESPSVRLFLTDVVFMPGSVLPEGTDAARSRADLPPLRSVQARKVVSDFLAERKATKYDVAMMLTRRWIEPKQGGLAYGVATMNSLCRHPNNVILIVEEFAYSGIYTAVHELAHLMGVRHDEDAVDCEEPRHRYLMSGSTQPRHPSWSACSQREFRRANGRFPCVRSPPAGRQVSVQPPGVTRSRLQQCSFLERRSSSPTDCLTTACDQPIVVSELKHPRQFWLLDGTHCQDDQHACLARQCVDLQQVLDVYAAVDNAARADTEEAAGSTPQDSAQTVQHTGFWASVLRFLNFFNVFNISSRSTKYSSQYS